MRVLFLEIGVCFVEVFGSCERFAAWCAICPGNNESAGKRRSASVRHGNSVVQHPGRMRTGRRTHQRLSVPRLPQGTDDTLRLQARHCSNHSQSGTLRVRCVTRPPPVCRLPGRLLGGAGQTQRSAMHPTTSIRECSSNFEDETFVIDWESIQA